MLRVVVDANVHVSAIIRPEGPPGRVIERFVRDAAFEIVLSPAIVEETLRALTYAKVRKYVRGTVDPQLWFEDIVLLAELVAGDYQMSPVSADPDDDKYLAAALEGRATLVVTGDPDLLALEEHQGVRIVNPRVFLGLLGG
ncbi:MAG TPA: putative toxin-antitoxin system toxin component, PIN family [Vicinamibacterales bacterium]|nr:putative toxin-antitoxin system toxin component, PIN family [Vicinamibacterales bacterium]